MFFEGVCKYFDLPEVFANAMTSIPSGETEPIWQMVSSKIGNTVDDDGYVFYSKGSEGTRDIYVGVKKAFNNGNNMPTHGGWYYGWRFFIAEEYTPSPTANTNGVFKNYFYNAMPHAYNSGQVSYVNAGNLDVKYFMNINKDRVILYVEPMVTHPEIWPNMIYLGRPETFDARDQYFNILGVAVDYLNNWHSSIRAIGDHIGVKGISTSHSVLYDITPYNNRLNGTVLPATIFLSHRGTFRGRLDIKVLHQDGTLRKKDTYVIDGKEYIGVELNYYRTVDGVSKHNNFSRDTTTKVYLVPKF